MIFTTQSGSIYEVSGLRVRRIPGEGAGDLREDGDWLDLVDAPKVEVGRSARLIIRGIGHSSNFTVRTTTPVTEVSE